MQPGILDEFADPHPIREFMDLLMMVRCAPTLLAQHVQRLH